MCRSQNPSISCYSKLLVEIADEGETVVRGVPVTREHYYVIVFAVHSFLRPAETELFGIRFCDIETQTDPDHLLITLTGKTGYRKSATMPEAVDILQKVKEMYSDASPTDYVFMPQYPNRTTALNTYRRIFILCDGVIRWAYQ